MKIGYSLASEDFTPQELLHQAALAEEAGFAGLWISDHYHPWTSAQGHSPFVWSVIGGLAQVTTLPVMTGVTCPTTRIHPAIIAQAAATCAVMLEGRFRLGVGTGEALNEHILGDRWPGASVRLEMLEEAIEVMRLLWQGGQRSHHGKHYTVENARVYDLPEEQTPIIVASGGPRSLELAARVGDGLATVSAHKERVDTFRAHSKDKLVIGATKVSWDTDKERALQTAHRLWPLMGLKGELPQVLPTPTHFEQAFRMVTPEMVAKTVPCGSDLGVHLAHMSAFAEAGFDEVYVQNIGPYQEEFFAFYSKEVLPNFHR